VSVAAAEPDAVAEDEGDAELRPERVAAESAVGTAEAAALDVKTAVAEAAADAEPADDSDALAVAVDVAAALAVADALTVAVLEPVGVWPLPVGCADGVVKGDRNEPVAAADREAAPLGVDEVVAALVDDAVPEGKKWGGGACRLDPCLPRKANASRRARAHSCL